MREEFTVDDDNIYDMVVRPEAFDSLHISDVMTFKERTGRELADALGVLDMNTNNISMADATTLLQRQLGPEYELVYWRTNDTYYDAIVQAPHKMYGILILVPKGEQWQPKVLGYVFDDKINMISGVKGTLADFKTWPFHSERPLTG